MFSPPAIPNRSFPLSLSSLLLRSAPCQHNPHSLQYDLDIHPKVPVPDIFHIKLYHFFEICDITPAAHLPHTGESGLIASLAL